MIKIGITGGIGSGKSIIASIMELYSIPVYMADAESKILTATSPLIREQLTALFGSNLYNENGLDKQLLASYIFNNQSYLDQVNAIIHPAVNRHFQAWAQRQEGKFCAIESAILFESGFDKIVDIRLMVYAPKNLRIERASARDATPREEIIRRVNNQLPDELKKERSDYVINNDDQEALLPQVGKLLDQLRSSQSNLYSKIDSNF